MSGWKSVISLYLNRYRKINVCTSTGTHKCVPPEVYVPLEVQTKIICTTWYKQIYDMVHQKNIRIICTTCSTDFFTFCLYLVRYKKDECVPRRVHKGWMCTSSGTKRMNVYLVRYKKDECVPRRVQKKVCVPPGVQTNLHFFCTLWSTNFFLIFFWVYHMGQTYIPLYLCRYTFMCTFWGQTNIVCTSWWYQKYFFVPLEVQTNIVCITSWYKIYFFVSFCTPRGTHNICLYHVVVQIMFVCTSRGTHKYVPSEVQRDQGFTSSHPEKWVIDT